MGIYSYWVDSLRISGLRSLVVSWFGLCGPKMAANCHVSSGRKVDEEKKITKRHTSPPQWGSFKELYQIPHIIFYWLLLSTGSWGKRLLEVSVSAANSRGVLLVKKKGRIDVGRQLAVSTTAICSILTYQVCFRISSHWSLSIMAPVPQFQWQ